MNPWRSLEFAVWNWWFGITRAQRRLVIAVGVVVAYAILDAIL